MKRDDSHAITIRRTLLCGIASVVLLAAVSVTFLALASGLVAIQLPTGWRLSPATGLVRDVGLFPQGIALSPNGRSLAIVNSGFDNPSLVILNAKTLSQRREIALPGAFGMPVWLDASHLLVAGANDDAIENIYVGGDEVNRSLFSGTIKRIALPEGSWPVQVALSPDHRVFAASDDMTGNVSFGNVNGARAITTVHIGGPAEGIILPFSFTMRNYRNPSDLLFSPDGKFLYVALRGADSVAVVNLTSQHIDWITVGMHPSALALSQDGAELYVAATDDDALDIIDTSKRKLVASVDLRLHHGRAGGYYGASPNAIVVGPRYIYVSLGAENAVAVVRNRKVVGRIPTGWYPTGLALGPNAQLYVANAKGEEGTTANPGWNRYLPDRIGDPVTSIIGSVRLVNAHTLNTAAVLANAGQDWVTPPQTIVRPNGPIKHVIYIIKENRSYDQILGDIASADGDPKLVWFGQRVTPNQHAMVKRFGILDRAFVESQISDDGHSWSTAAFATDYLERFQVQYSRDPVYDFEDGAIASVPHSGYLWDDAARAGITYRDYGEFTRYTQSPWKPGETVVSDMPHLDDGHVAPHYPGWNLDISDQVRYEPWESEFKNYVSNRDLPQLEIIRLPNDHTKYTCPGALTPQAYVAQNDYAFGEIVDAVSHSPYWATTAIFAVEDDTVDGPDHVNAQRGPFYVVSPYAKPGVNHAMYTTSGFLHTIEILLGMKPMTVYDAGATPLYAAFASKPVNSRPFTVIPPHVNVHARISNTAWGSTLCKQLGFKIADQGDPALLDDIMAHAVRSTRQR